MLPCGSCQNKVKNYINVFFIYSRHYSNKLKNYHYSPSYLKDDLPEGWIMRKTPGGQELYINYEQNQKNFEKPKQSSKKVSTNKIC